jgi:GntR family transcriptional regulator
MLIQLNFRSGKPVYLQIVDQIKAAVVAGVLRKGESLPSIRPLAEELRVNRNTIAKAYTELEHQGVIEAEPGKGCFIKAPGTTLKKEHCRKVLLEEVDSFLVQALHFQFSPEEILELIRKRLEQLEPKVKHDNDQRAAGY